MFCLPFSRGCYLANFYYVRKKILTMTIRNLLNIILKVIGILFIRDVLALLPQLLSSFIFFNNVDQFHDGTLAIALTAIMILVYVFVARTFIFKTEMVLNALRLDHDFEEEKVAVQMHRSTILSISIIVIGGLMVAEGLPKLCQSIYDYNQVERYSYGEIRLDRSKIYTSVATVFLGILLMALQQKLVNLIELKRK